MVPGVAPPGDARPYVFKYFNAGQEDLKNNLTNPMLFSVTNMSFYILYRK